MYIVTSKPKRISVNSGLVHIVFSRNDKVCVICGREQPLYWTLPTECAGCIREPAHLDGKVESFSAKASPTPTKKSANSAHDFHEFGASNSPLGRCLTVPLMTSVSANGVVFFDPLPEPWHRNKAAGWALGISVFVHALAIAFLPGLRIVQPQPKVLTVALAPKPAQKHASAPAVAEKPAAAPQATEQPKAVPHLRSSATQVEQR